MHCRDQHRISTNIVNCREFHRDAGVHERKIIELFLMGPFLKKKKKKINENIDFVAYVELTI